MSRPGLTDEQLAVIDVPAIIEDGLRSRDGGRQWLAEGAVAAAIQANRLHVLPRSLTFLAEIVRRGGLAYAAELPQPLPAPEQAAMVKGWLSAAVTRDDAMVARWLDAVAMILDARQKVRLT
jgi:hypothetical protein